MSIHIGGLKSQDFLPQTILPIWIIQEILIIETAKAAENTKAHRKHKNT